ncbi:tumor necrosis factor receptor superfamily member 14-like isoform 2-T2 [Clarias gariepinus]|uniref:tumor necrosis factor receptor superfamily member 14-like isoform X2 n=1 Tax=Clarias gariepinus TaxID=13013 RepID=UPI00234C3B19|nr:tumor necrosis factor receptor superfamily member 14-like isoform X2 [Clarias gariepinus]
MISVLQHTFIIAAISFLNFELCCCLCRRAEYEANGECCLMCSPGKQVYKNCTEIMSTACIPCDDSTYTDEPNGLSKCISCAMCDTGAGLKVKTPCTRISNTVCEPLEGFYCIDEERGSCRQAVEHTKCKPGQYIKQKDGTYSNGFLQMCQKHTKCEDLGLEEKTPGTNSLDVKCRRKTQVALRAGILFAVALIVLIAEVLIIKIRCDEASVRGDTADNTRLSDNQKHESDTSRLLV